MLGKKGKIEKKKVGKVSAHSSLTLSKSTFKSIILNEAFGLRVHYFTSISVLDTHV